VGTSSRNVSEGGRGRFLAWAPEAPEGEADLQPSATIPRGPKGPAFVHALRARRDPFGTLERLARDYGDVVCLRLAGRRAYIINDPALIRGILVDQAKAFPRGAVSPLTERLLGGSIVGSEGADHHRKKAAALPTVNHERLERTLETAAREVDSLEAEWRPGSVRDVAEDMYALSMQIAASSLFSIRDPAKVAELRRLLESAMGGYQRSLHPARPLLDRFPSRRTREARDSTTRLLALVDGLVERRLASPPRQGDALDVLVGVRRGEGGSNWPSAPELRAIALDLLIASVATIGHALTWTLHDLAALPAVQEAVAGEAHFVLDGKAPGLAEVGQLNHAQACFKEGLRLHPPVWAFVRRTAGAVVIGGLALPSGAFVVLSPRLTQRDVRFFPEPSRFDPSRWAESAPPAGGGMTYFPFGAGPYGCLGEGLAMAQGTLVLAMLVRDFSFATAPGPPPQEPAAALQPRRPVLLGVHARAPRGSPSRAPTP